jgi:hypothetical protein
MKAGAKAKASGWVVEAGEHDLAAGREARDQACRAAHASPLTS